MRTANIFFNDNLETFKSERKIYTNKSVPWVVDHTQMTITINETPFDLIFFYTLTQNLCSQILFGIARIHTRPIVCLSTFGPLCIRLKTNMDEINLVRSEQSPHSELKT
jgi:hypothetical protein